MNKKIKVIDLINWIYQNMNVPQKIKYEDEVYIYEESTQDYYDDEHHCYLFEKIVVSGEKWLLNEVEILEDEEEIDIQAIEDLGISSNNIAEKISELIRAVKQLDKKSNKEE